MILLGIDCIGLGVKIPLSESSVCYFRSCLDFDYLFVLTYSHIEMEVASVVHRCRNYSEPLLPVSPVRQPPERGRSHVNSIEEQRWHLILILLERTHI